MKTFTCKECRLEYLDAKTAKECEKYCRDHNSCSLEITRKAITKPNSKAGGK